MICLAFLLTIISYVHDHLTYSPNPHIILPKGNTKSLLSSGRVVVVAVTLTLAKLRCVQASVYLFLANHPTQAPHPVHSLARNSNVFLIRGISFPTPWGE